MSKSEEHNCDDDIEIPRKIEQYGWMVIMIEATAYLPSFAYTIGLWQTYKHPEIISFGLTVKTLHIVLNNAGEQVKEGKSIEINKTYHDFFESSRTKFIKLDPKNIPDYFGTAINYYKTREFPAIQLIWTDRNDQFPWDKNYESEFKFRQPLLDRNAKFKFREEWNLGVFTTRQFLDLNKPILRVVHDHNGDWQFLTGDQLLQDARLVTLASVVEMDNTLNEVFNLDYGEAAERENIGKKWIRSKVQDDEEENGDTKK